MFTKWHTYLASSEYLPFKRSRMSQKHKRKTRLSLQNQRKKRKQDLFEKYCKTSYKTTENTAEDQNQNLYSHYTLNNIQQLNLFFFFLFSLWHVIVGQSFDLRSNSIDGSSVV